MMELNQMFDFKRFKEILEQKPEIVITTHVNPDGDAIGSLLGMYNFFVKLGFSINAITPNEYPEFLQWLPGNTNVLDYSKNKKKAEKIIESAKLIIHLDYNDYRRAGDMKDLLVNSPAVKVMVDHHPFPQLNSDFIISRTEVSSTAELVYEFISELHGMSVFDRDIAECIYTGIMTDTGCFNFNSSRPRTFEIVSQLLGYGIRKDEIFRLVYDNFSEHRMRLLGHCLSNRMEVFHEYGTALMSLSMADQELFKFETGDSEGFVNYPLSIKGIQVAAFFTERKDRVKISLRSRGNFAVNSVCEKYFDGGGHTNAAGGESFLSLQDTIQKFVSLLPTFPELANK